MRIVLAEDSVLLREGIARLLGDAGFEVVAQAGDAEDLMRKVRAHKPDVAIVDIRMPPTHTDDGLRAALTIRRELPDTAVLVLSSYVQADYAVELLGESAAGVGYLLKDRVADVERFIDSIRRVASGGSALDPEVVSQMLGRHRAAAPLDELTPREREVLVLMAEGRSNHAIAAELVISDRAVKKHVTSIFGKLNLSSTADDHRRVLAVLAFLNAQSAGVAVRSGGLYGGLAMSDTEGKVRRPSGPGRRAAAASGHRAGALEGLGAEGASVLVLGSEELDDACWAVLLEAGVLLERVLDVADALRALTDRRVPVVIAGARLACELTTAVRNRRAWRLDCAQRVCAPTRRCCGRW